MELSAHSNEGGDISGRRRVQQMNVSNSVPEFGHQGTGYLNYQHPY